MLGRYSRTGLPAPGLVLCAFLFSPASAWADSGQYLRLYAQLGLGYGEWTGQELVVREEAGNDNDVPVAGSDCCIGGAFATQARLGLSLFNVVAPEGFIVASGTDFDSRVVGGGFVGGGLRVFPLGIFQRLGVLNLDGFPLDFSFAGGFAYALAGGQDAFSYDGTAFGFDVTAEYLLDRMVSLGLRVDVWFPNYDAFAVTSRSNNTGRCLNENGRQVGLDTPEQRVNRDDNACGDDGRGPNTTLISPQLLLTFRFDLL